MNLPISPKDPSKSLFAKPSLGGYVATLFHSSFLNYGARDKFMIMMKHSSTVFYKKIPLSIRANLDGIKAIERLLGWI